MSKNSCTILQHTLKYALGYGHQIPERERKREREHTGQVRQRKLPRANSQIQTSSCIYLFWVLASGQAFKEVIVRKGISFTNWLGRRSKEQAPEEFCSTQLFRGPQHVNPPSECLESPPLSRVWVLREKGSHKEGFYGTHLKVGAAFLHLIHQSEPSHGITPNQKEHTKKLIHLYPQEGNHKSVLKSTNSFYRSGHQTSSLFFFNMLNTFTFSPRHNIKFHLNSKSLHQTLRPRHLNLAYMAVAPYDPMTYELNGIYNGVIRKDYQNRNTHSEEGIMGDTWR